MPQLRFDQRDLASPRFKTLVRALGRREDTALGFILLFWHRTRAAKLVDVRASEVQAFFSCDFDEQPRFFEALLIAGYLEPLTPGPLENATLRIVDNGPALRARAIRQRVAEAGGQAYLKKYGPMLGKNRVAAKVALVAAAPPPARAKAVRSRKLAVPSEHLEATRAAWDAYAQAYARVTGHAPLRNAKQNAHIKQFCQRVPHEDAPGLIRFYVGHRHQVYRERIWPLDMLVKDAESLYTQYKTNVQVTRAQVMDIARTEQNARTVARYNAF